MKLIVLIIFSFFGLLSNTIADTISYCHVYYNEIKIQEFSEFGINEIILQANDIGKKDSLRINYYTCSIFFDCNNLMTVEDGTDYVITSAKSLGQKTNSKFLFMHY